MNTDDLTFEDSTFEARARQAADGVNRAVNSAELQLFAAGIPALRTSSGDSRRFSGSERWVAVAGAFAAVLIVLGIALLPGRLFAPDSEVATTEATVPDGIIPPIVTVPTTDSEPPITEETSEEPTTTVPIEETSTTLAIDSTPPELAITTPDNDVTVSDYLMQFRGTTEPGAHVIAAGEWEADVDDLGNWEIILGLNSGPNIVTFTAVDGAGNETSAQVTVNYNPPSPTTTTTIPEGEPGGGEGEGTESEVVQFSAFAQFETCSENPPFNVYWGTAQAGHKVTVSSEFGEGHVFADMTGNWEIRVEFPEAPYGEEFVVTVKHVESNQTRAFGLTSLAEG